MGGKGQGGRMQEGEGVRIERWGGKGYGHREQGAGKSMAGQAEEEHVAGGKVAGRQVEVQGVKLRGGGRNSCPPLLLSLPQQWRGGGENKFKANFY